jgi:tyrosyl-tRNA synthetase
VDVLPPATAEEGRAAAEELAELIRKYCGGTTEVVSIGGEQLSATIDPQITEQLVRAKLKDDRIRRLLDEHGDELSDSDDMSQWSLRDLLLRGNIEQVVVENDFIARLDKGDKLTIYQGFDPTSPNLHVGHLVSLRILRWFQLRGHRVIFLLGDATALIGDPSGRSEQREMLTHEQVKENMATYKEQAGLVLDFDGGPNPVELLKNSDWILFFRLEDILELMSHVTVLQLLQRNMFKVRMKKKDNPLYYNETIYPLFQGYDSVAMKVDAELGGRDQLFNMLTGRDLEREYLKKEKFVLTTPLLPGFDGRKMSKTYGNTVNLTATPFEIFDGIMRVKDELILQYARLLTNIPWSELARLEALLPDDPRAVKERVAFELVQALHDKERASEAREEFIRVRRAKTAPQEILEVRIPGSPSEAALIDVLVKATPAIVTSKSELRRRIRQGNIILNGELVSDEKMRCDVGTLDGQVLQIGKARFFRLVVE